MAATFRTPSPRSSSYYHSFHRSSPSPTRMHYKFRGDWDNYFGKQHHSLIRELCIYSMLYSY
ncbi:hypothetical protein C0J52_14490 [Blattella germanica]|nr:hypothetical protein C0J52_14490 [Blattella germanica]